jgi:23S rRNA (cytidine1920-2'-O)/16S rRNA (cytidine1409-2'-O)-methyltransferase
MSAKKRLDVLLVERGLAESRSQAQGLLAGVKGTPRPASRSRSAELEVAAGARFVSRGGEARGCAGAFGLDVASDCLDVSA